MFYIFYISLALLNTCNFVTTYSFDDGETKRLKLGLNALKNAAEVVRVLNEDGADPPTHHQEEGYGKQEDDLQGIDLDYLGINEGRNLDMREVLQLIQKNRDAKEKYALMKPDPSRIYFISNPHVLENYRENVKGYERDSSASDEPDKYEKRIKDLWELVNPIRRDAAENEKGGSMKMVHPRLLHLSLEKQVPSFGTNIGDENEVKKGPNLQYLKVIKDEANNKYSTITSALLKTTKQYISLLGNDDVTKKDALRTTRENFQDDNVNKKSMENTSEDDETRYSITRIDFKAKDASKEDFEGKSLERYPKKEKKQKKDSKFDDNDDLMRRSKETTRSTLKRKERTSTLDDNYSTYTKKKRDRWEKEDRGRWGKREERSEERTKYKPPRKEERYYEMSRPKYKPLNSRPISNKESRLHNNMGNNIYKPYGRTPIPIVGKRVVYEED